FDEDINAGFDQGARRLDVVDGGNRNRCCLYFAAGGDQLLEGSERATAEFARYRIGAGRIFIDHSDQADSFALALELLVHAGMVSPESSCAYDNDLNVLVPGQ
ncbi:MAG TPA: hypothetical protein VGF08_13120, partial [Terriglobales bacterium]